MAANNQPNFSFFGEAVDQQRLLGHWTSWDGKLLYKWWKRKKKIQELHAYIEDLGDITVGI